MHKNHLVGCGAGIALALAVVALSGGSAGTLGVLVAVLICPVAMVGAMWFLMGGPRSRGDAHGTETSATAEMVAPDGVLDISRVSPAVAADPKLPT